MSDRGTKRRCFCGDRGLTAHEQGCVIFSMPMEERTPFLFAQYLADERALRPTPPPPSETPITAWLIERGQPENQRPPMWWRAYTIGKGDEWTEDAGRAHRFTTRQEAGDVIAEKSGYIGDRFGRATEHIWCDLSTEDSWIIEKAKGENNANVGTGSPSIQPPPSETKLENKTDG